MSSKACRSRVSHRGSSRPHRASRRRASRHSSNRRSSNRRSSNRRSSNRHSSNRHSSNRHSSNHRRVVGEVDSSKSLTPDTLF